jgi:hypothetical protein
LLSIFIYKSRYIRMDIRQPLLFSKTFSNHRPFSWTVLNRFASKALSLRRSSRQDVHSSCFFRRKSLTLRLFQIIREICMGWGFSLGRGRLKSDGRMSAPVMIERFCILLIQCYVIPSDQLTDRTGQVDEPTPRGILTSTVHILAWN